MKKIISTFLAALPVMVLAAPVTVTWDPYPVSTATMHIECRKVGGTFAEIGSAPATGSVSAESGVGPGESGECRAWATQAGYQDSPRSGVAAFQIPLGTLQGPTGVRVVP